MNTRKCAAIMACTSTMALLSTAMPSFAHGADESAPTAPIVLAQDSVPAQAKDGSQPKSDDQAKPDKDIVVTGSQIRGATPGGASLLTTTAAQAEAVGAANGNEILENLPQAANVFQSLPSLGGNTPGGNQAAARLPFSAISLRNLPNVNTGGTALTLNLLDGHRLVPMGTDVLGGQGVDSSSIGTSTLLRTEIMPDGGSAIYGSDAVAGVINYITRDEFDGVQLQARGGLAGSYKQYDASVTAGTKWDTGAIYASAAYSYHDALFGKDRAYIHAIDANPNSPLFGTPLGLNCLNPNIAITSLVGGISSRRLYPETAPGGTIQPYTTNNGTNGSGSAASAAGIAGGNRCDSTDYQEYFPKSRAINANFGFRQAITDNLTFSLKGYWNQRKSTVYIPLTLTTSPTVTSTNPNYRPVCNAPVVAPAIQPAGPICGVTPGYFAGDNNLPQTITTDFSSVLGPTVQSYVNISAWQVTPQLTWNFAKDWQVRGLFSYGESRSDGIQGAADGTVLAGRILSGLINPYNLPASGAGAFTNLITYSDKTGRFHLLDARVVADGPLPFLHLPGGDIRVAIGGEYTSTTLLLSATGSVLSPTPNNFVLDQQNPVPGQPLKYTQTVKSAFGEVNIPLVSDDMHIPLISSFNISASGRYDKYNDFGDTFNPMVGATWAITPWFKIRGNWNTSFAAPNNLTELASFTGASFNAGTQNNAATPLPFFQGVTPPGGTNATAPLGIAAVLTNGTKKGIGPQTSESWSIGFDMSPPIVPGLSFGMSYYDLKISNVIGSPVAPNPQSVFDQHPELIYCTGGVKGNAANAATVCATPMSSAELQAASPGYAVAANPLTGGGGLATAASLINTGTAGNGTGAAGAGPAVSWPTIFANYCEPAAYAAHTCAAGTYTVFYVIDNRQTNLGFVFSRGIDFHAAYRTNVPWGSIDAGVNGTYNLATQVQAGALSAVVDNQLTGFSEWRMSANVGTTWGGLRAQVIWNHSAGYDLSSTASGTVGTSTIPGTAAYGQTHVSAYDTFDLFFRYKFDDLGGKNSIFKGLTATLNVNNFLDIDPPILGGGFTNGTTLGRLLMFGLTKDFK